MICFVARRCVLSISLGSRISRRGKAGRAGASCVMFTVTQMSRTTKSSNDSKDERKMSDNSLQPTQVMMASGPTQSMSSVSTATFSSMSKQAESLVNGGTSVVFNPYNNNLVFRWISMNLNDCVSIDTINRALANISSIGFTSGGTMTGISDGFIVDDRGQIVQLYDPTIALSCAFGYKIQTESTETSNRLDVEIERRQLDFSQLLLKYQETDRNARHAESMIHYIDFNLTDHVMTFKIPVEDASGTLSHGDMLPAETMEYGEIVPGEHNPHVGIDEVPMIGFTSKDVVTVDRDGVLVDGVVVTSGNVVCNGVVDAAVLAPTVGTIDVIANVSCDGSLTVNGDVVAQADMTVANNVAAMGYVYGNSGIGFPEYSITIENPDDRSENAPKGDPDNPTVVTFPEVLIVGIAQTFDVVSTDLLPSSQAIYDLTKSMMEVIAADFEAKQELINLNASMIDGIKNSCGGLETETDPYCEDSKTWRLWVYIRKWIIKALRESLNNENPPEWEENLPSIADAISTSTFGPEWKKYMSLSEGGGTIDPYIKIGHEATTTRYDVCNLYVDGSTMGGVMVGKDSQCGVYSYNWLVVHGYVDYKNSGVHFLCEGVAEFKNDVAFKGGVSGISYNSLADKPNVYTKDETYSQIEVDGMVSGVLDECSQLVLDETKELRERVAALEKQCEELLAIIKSMSTYDEILFRLIDLTKEIMNVKTTCSNLDNRIIALESAKGDVDALKQNVVELQSWKSTTEQTLTTLDERVTALEGGA